MKIKVLFFAYLKKYAAMEEMCLEVPSYITLGKAKSILAESIPLLGPYLSNVKCAVNLEIVGEDAVLQNNDEVAMLPPYSGG